MKLTDAELAKMPPKAHKDPRAIELFRDYDFLEAYARHTDRRVLEGGYKGAVGNEADWISHGMLQRDFLLAVGLAPAHRLLEVGCGTGRLARQIVPRLEVGHYVGVDISLEAVRAAMLLSGAEGWAKYQPRFYQGNGPPVDVAPVDYAWAYSVFIHLPPPEIVAVMQGVAAVLKPAGRFYWSFVPERANARTGLKQFRATRDVYKACARAAGLTFHDSPGWIELAGYRAANWTGHQHVALSMRVP